MFLKDWYSGEYVYINLNNVTHAYTSIVSRDKSPKSKLVFLFMNNTSLEIFFTDLKGAENALRDMEGILSMDGAG